MGEIICLIICALTIVLLTFIFKINVKKAKELENNKNVQIITDKFPENIDIAKEMLEMLNNKNVKIEQAKNTKTSLYIAFTNKISIADLKDNYGRIQTIAHECIHSMQDRTLLLFNFIFSNISIIYFALAIILTLCKVYTNTMLQVFILTMFTLINFSVRAYLEIDAMTKSRYLAEKYMNQKNLCTKDEQEKLLKEYDKINKVGIPFTLYYLLTNSLIRIMLYIVIAIII